MVAELIAVLRVPITVVEAGWVVVPAPIVERHVPVIIAGSVNRELTALADLVGVEKGGELAGRSLIREDSGVASLTGEGGWDGAWSKSNDVLNASESVGWVLGHGGESL